VIPELRNSHFEQSRSPVHQMVIYAARKQDLERELVPSRARRVRVVTGWTWAFRHRWKTVELPELLWLRALPLTLSVGLCVRVADLLTGRRTSVVAYAIENSDANALFGAVPSIARRPLLGFLRMASRILFDRMVFGSEGAADCYRSLALVSSRCRTRILLELPVPCSCGVSAEKTPTVTFVGAFEQRKGVSMLLDAWEAASLPDGWRLALAGQGPLNEDVRRAARESKSVLALGPVGRDDVHVLMRESSIVILPSRRDGRWREQIGLPILEGLAHGCYIITTDDTGLAGWLIRNGHTVIPHDYEASVLSSAIEHAVNGQLQPPGTVCSALPSIAGRISAEDWLYEDSGDHCSDLAPMIVPATERGEEPF
jgi:glycosyltransferase involved in cell wall biosynthesis